jgi:hypothetical protein
METLSKKLAKRGLGLAAGAQLVALGRKMDEARNAPKNEKEQTYGPDEMEYVFSRRGTEAVHSALEGLVNTLSFNGVLIDTELLNKVNTLMHHIGKLLEETKDGNQA